MMDVNEAERSGLVSRIVPVDKLMDETMAAAEKIAAMSRPAAAMAKRAVNRAFETPLSEGMPSRLTVSSAPPSQNPRPYRSPSSGTSLRGRTISASHSSGTTRPS